jgi:hypothetical protein
MESFDPNSPAAMFATILARLKNQDREMIRVAREVAETVEAKHSENSTVLESILVQTKLTNGRVIILEGDVKELQGKWKYALGWIAGAVAVATVVLWLAAHFLV